MKNLKLFQLLISLGILLLASALTIIVYQNYLPNLKTGDDAPSIDTYDIDLLSITIPKITQDGLGLLLFIDDPEDPSTVRYFDKLSDQYSTLITYNTHTAVVSRKGNDLLIKLRSKTQAFMPYIFDVYLEICKNYHTKHRLTNTIINTTILINSKNKIVFYKRGLVPVDKIIEIAKQLSSNK